MFNFNKRKSEEGEIFQGITETQIADIHAYLDDTFDLATDATLEGGSTIFNVTGIPNNESDAAIEHIQQQVGDKFLVEYREESVHNNVLQIIRVSSKN